MLGRSAINSSHDAEWEMRLKYLQWLLPVLIFGCYFLVIFSLYSASVIFSVLNVPITMNFQ